MIFLIILGYFILEQPYTFQKEASARSLISLIGHENVKPEFQPMMDAATCRLDKMIPTGIGRPMFPEAALICTFDTPCGKPAERLVWHKRIIGAFTSAEPTSWTIYDTCPEMLNSASLKDVEDFRDQGG